MTKFPDSESSKVCPGHIPENFVPKHGRTVQLTADTGLGTAEGQALPLGGLEATAHQGRDAGLVSLTPTEWTLAQPSLVSSPPHPHPSSHTALKLYYFYLETNRMAEKTPPPHSWGWAGNRSGVRAGFLPAGSLEYFCRSAAWGPGCLSQY